MLLIGGSKVCVEPAPCTLEIWYMIGIIFSEILTKTTNIVTSFKTPTHTRVFVTSNFLSRSSPTTATRNNGS